MNQIELNKFILEQEKVFQVVWMGESELKCNATNPIIKNLSEVLQYIAKTTVKNEKISILQ